MVAGFRCATGKGREEAAISVGRKPAETCQRAEKFALEYWWITHTQEAQMKAAAVQMDVKILAKEHNLDQILSRLEQAAGAGAKLAVFPECALSGYCFASREEAAPVAEEVPGPSTERILAAARALDCTVVVGLLERAGYADEVVVKFGRVAVHGECGLAEAGVERVFGESLVSEHAPVRYRLHTLLARLLESRKPQTLDALRPRQPGQSRHRQRRCRGIDGEEPQPARDGN